MRRIARPALLLLGLAAATVGPAPPAAAEPLAVEEIAPGVFVHEGRHEEASPDNAGGIANVGFIVGDEAVAVIDTGGSAAGGGRLRDAILRVTGLPIRYVVNTHMHPDHVLGNAAFMVDGATFVGHAKLPRALAERGSFYLDNLREALGTAADGSKIVPPTLLVGDSLELDIGGRVLRVVAYGTAHTDNDVTVLDLKTETLFAGDLLFIERIPVVDGDLKGWLAATDRLRQTRAARVVPGHGPAGAPWPGSVSGQERYLRLLLEEVRALIAAGGTIEQALATVGRSERDKWLLFDAYHGRNILAAFTALEWE